MSAILSVLIRYELQNLGTTIENMNSMHSLNIKLVINIIILGNTLFDQRLALTS